jgi:tRNA A-37 threonylcarbamoyl transferase component Bud32
MLNRIPYGKALRAELGRLGRARRLGSSPRSRVWRVEVAHGPVIIKQIVGPDDAGHRYAREVTALRLAGRVDPPVVPGLLATDPDARVLVLEHLPDDKVVDGWQVDYAAALARLHAAGRLVDPGTLPAWSGPTAADVDAFVALADQLRVPVSPPVVGDLHGLIDGPSRASAQSLLHGDPCPDNFRRTATGTRFIDLEHAALGDGLVELAYLRIGYPTCWCVTSIDASLLGLAEDSYRAAWRTATGEELRGDAADACIGWLLRGDALVPRAERGPTDQLARTLDTDWRWGTVTARERLAYRLDVVTKLVSDRPEHARLGALTTAMRDAMLRRWPELQPPPAQRP